MDRGDTGRKGRQIREAKVFSVPKEPVNVDKICWGETRGFTQAGNSQL